MNSKRMKLLAYFEEFDNLPQRKVFGSGDSPEEMYAYISHLYGQNVTIETRYRRYSGILMDPFEAIRQDYTWEGREIKEPQYLLYVVTDQEEKDGISITHYSALSHCCYVVDLVSRTIVELNETKEEFEARENGMNKKAYFEDAMDGVNVEGKINTQPDGSTIQNKKTQRSLLNTLNSSMARK